MIFRILLLLLSVPLSVSCNSEVAKILPSKSTVTESVYSSVTVQPDSLYQAFAPVNGILDKNLVEEGDPVKKNTAIVQIIDNSPKLNSQNARLSYALAEENYLGNAAILRSLEKEIANAKLKLVNDSINYYRQKNLWDRSIGSKAEFDTKKLAFEVSSNSVKILQENYFRTSNELKTRLNQANNNYKTSLIVAEDYTLRSKIEGKVYALYKNPGEIVSTMEPLAAVGSSHNFIIEMLVDEVDIVKVKLEQRVLVNLDAYKGRIFTAKVTKIFPKKDERNQTFKVEAAFDETPETVYPGLSGEANIIIAMKTNVLTLPKEYLTDGSKVRTENGLTEVITGLEDLEVVEIISGITEDTWILKPEE
jgi:multidrug efflux pump subunit AcrA (membrane-fusion protein)